ncbi:hypothetical protein LCGC14_1435340 [marine sediment metagenome]|uniref:Uncharacterized protein n=1 Tax=marine sediment metagenome TaxID=412755 RepID=A0A0F9JMV4_9ZZZZ
MKDLVDCVVALKSAQLEMKQARKNARKHSVECGEALLKIKKILSPGDFEYFLETGFNGTTKQASHYMAIANGRAS